VANQEELFKHLLGFDPFNINRVNTYPFHNVIKHGNNYTIEVACAGFKREELDVVTDNGELIITGAKKVGVIQGDFLHNGISSKSFEKRWILEPNMRVVGADYTDGIITVKVEKHKDNTAKRIMLK
jgi:molecular chaperone IbpA